MHKKNFVRSGLLSLLMVASLISCGSSESGSNTGKKTDKGSTTPIANKGPIQNLDSLQDDLTLDEEGKVTFEDQVDLKVWCIIGDPDAKVFDELVTKFNNEYQGLVHLNVTHLGHFDFYNNLDTTATMDPDGLPDVLIMHNEKTAEYASKGIILPLDDITKKTTIQTDYSTVYENIDRVTKYQNKRYAVPVDAHGFVTSIRQDIIKKNNLGFDNNTRYIPESRTEYQQLLEGLRNKADANQLYIRNINKGQDHSWKIANPSDFYPEFIQSSDPDGLSALYANGGRMANDEETKITFHENEGYKTYILDQVRRYNSRLMGEGESNTEAFAKGNTIFFSEGPWWVSQTYTLNWNNLEMKKEGKGVSAEDAADPVYNTPYTASHPLGWWTLDENKDTDAGKKWYGNGHAISLTKKVTSSLKAAAAMTFTNWYTQGKDADTDKYNLATWCNSGHIPAYKNVYESEEYKSYLSKSLTLRALGDPSNIIAMEGLAKEKTIFDCLASTITNIQGQMKSASGCTEQQALDLITKNVEDGQTSLDLTWITDEL